MCRDKCGQQEIRDLLALVTGQHLSSKLQKHCSPGGCGAQLQVELPAGHNKLIQQAHDEDKRATPGAFAQADSLAYLFGMSKRVFLRNRRKWTVLLHACVRHIWWPNCIRPACTHALALALALGCMFFGPPCTWRSHQSLAAVLAASISMSYLVFQKPLICWRHPVSQLLNCPSSRGLDHNDTKKRKQGLDSRTQEALTQKMSKLALVPCLTCHCRSHQHLPEHACTLSLGSLSR